jgi:hypothetical protein
MPTDGLITVDELREIFAINAQIKDARLERALAAAGRQMRSWVGDVAYDDALDDDPDDETRKEDLELAEAHLTMHFAILGINTALRPTGIVRDERVEAGSVIRYHSPDEIAKLKQQYLETAQDIARPYIILDETTVEPFGIAVVSDDSTCEAVTRRPSCC